MAINERHGQHQKDAGPLEQRAQPITLRSVRAALALLCGHRHRAVRTRGRSAAQNTGQDQYLNDGKYSHDQSQTRVGRVVGHGSFSL
jgi:hypothetical protein